MGCKEGISDGCTVGYREGRPDGRIVGCIDG